MSTNQRTITGGGLQFLASADYPDPTLVNATSAMELRETWFPAPVNGDTYSGNRIYSVDIQQASQQAPVTLRGALSGSASFRVPLVDPGAGAPAGVAVSADSGSNVPPGSSTKTMPVASPGRSAPAASRVALGYCAYRIRSRAVMRPRRWPAESTSGSFSILCQ